MRTYERHQLKQDKFAASVTEQISWAIEHRSTLIYGLIAVVVVIVAIAGGTWWWNYRSTQANVALGAAMQTYSAPIVPPNTPAPPEMQTFTSSQERARVAHAAFQKVAGQYGHTKAGQIARYMAALTNIDLGNTAAGERELKAVADSGNQDLAGLAKFTLAGIYRNSDRNKDALQLYKELVDKPTASVSKPMAQLELASLYDNTNQHGEAVKVYEDVIKNNPASPAAQMANQRLMASSKQP